MKNTAGTLIVLLILLSSNMAFGENKNDGNELLSDCNAALSFFTPFDSSKESSYDRNRRLMRANRCLDLFRGIKTLGLYYETILKEKCDNRILFCMPIDVNIQQASRVVVKYLTEHPERLHEPDIILMVEAFMQAFPCK